MTDEFIHEGKVRILQKNVVGKIEPPKLDAASKKRGRPSTEQEAGDAAAGDAAVTNNTLFYNPAQVFNRDISLLVLKVFGERRLGEAFNRFEGATTKRHVAEEVKGLTICEPLAATGLRSLRYASELPRSLLRRVTASDLDAFAVKQAKENRELNGVSPTKMEVVHAEATQLLHSGKFVCGTSSWDVIDIDPYGTASPFIEAAVSAVKDGGMLCITSTDMPILGGNSPDVAFYKYGGCTVKARYLHEMALRLVIHQLQMTAAKHRRFVVPLLSLSVDFYVRIFVQVWDKPVRCSDICLMTAIVYQCSSCDFFVTAPFGTESDKNAHSKKYRRTKRGPVPMPEAETAEAAPETETGEAAPETPSVGAATEKGKWPEVAQCHTYPISRTPGKRPTLGRVPSELTGPKCPECQGTLVIGGPFYAGPLHDQSFVKACVEEMEKAGSPVPDLLLDPEQQASLLESEEVSLEIENGFLGHKALGGRPKEEEDASDSIDPELALRWVNKAKSRFDYEMSVFRFTSLSKTVRDKINGVLRACSEELLEVPFFYNLSSICNHAKVSMIKLDKFKSALLHLGYQVGLFHREPLSIKTDAPVTVIFDIMRAWIQTSSKDANRPNSRTPPNYLEPLRLLPREHIDFTYHSEVNKNKKDQRPRWVPNPTAHWGPGRRAGNHNCLQD